jgi:hypothetical protein
MALPNRDAERLDRALDAKVKGKETGSSGPDHDLAATFDRIRSMNDRVEADASLKHQIWRSMLSTKSTTTSALVVGSERPKRMAARKFEFVSSNDRRSRQRGWLEPLAAILLVVAVVAGLLGVRQYREANESPSLFAQTVSLIPSDAPVASDCNSTAREPGTVEALAGTAPIVAPALPRFGDDPVFSESAGTGTSDGATLLLNSIVVNGSVEGVPDLLTQLVACRYYSIGSDGRLDMDGRYFALFSDDFFRRELAGYKEAGKDIRLVTFWRPSTVPVVLETRLYGDRLLLILQRPNDKSATYPVVMLSRILDRWQVDEFGFANMPSEWVTSDKLAAPTVAEVMGTPRMDIALYDKTTASPGMSSDNVCSPMANGAPSPCGQGYSMLGPYLYSDFPAGSDITFSLSNIGSDIRHFRIDGLGVNVDVEPGASATFVINAPAGTYLFEIYAGSDDSPMGSGVLTFVEPGTPRSVG